MANLDWGWYGSHLDVTINAIEGDSFGSITISSPDNSESITVHGVVGLLDNLNKVRSKALAKGINLDIHENMEILGLPEMENLPEEQKWSEPSKDHTLGKVLFRKVPNTDKAWGWVGEDVTIDYFLPEKSKDGAIKMSAGSDSLIFNGLSAFTILLEKAQRVAESKKIDIMHYEEDWTPSMSKADIDYMKQMRIKASRGGVTIISFTLDGKAKSREFSSPKVAAAFIKSASIAWGEHFKLAAPMPPVQNEPVTSGMSDIDNGAPTFHEASDEKVAGNMNFSPSSVPSQVLQEFYPEIQHETVSYPNATNSPMATPEVTGDMHSTPEYEEGELPGSIEDAFSGLSRIGYVSTSPAAGAGIGRDGKSQVLEGAPLRKENDIRGPMFTEEFYANYGSAVPGAALAIAAAKTAGSDEKTQFSIFLKRVMGEVVASFLSAFKVTSRSPLNMVPGVGEIQLALVEQSNNTSAFNNVNTGSRVKYLMDKLTDSEIQDGVNEAFAQGAVWHEGKEGGFVYEVFVRAESIDTESMLLKYKFIVGTRDSEK